MSNQINLEVSAGWLIENYLWDRYCEISGTSVWAVNEGRMDSAEKVSVPLKMMSEVIARLTPELDKEESNVFE